MSLRKKLENRSGYLKHNNKVLGKMDFMKNIVVMCDLIYNNGNTPSENRKKSICNIIGNVQGEIVLRVEKIENLRKINNIIENWRKTRDGGIWVEGTILDQYINGLDVWKRDRSDIVKKELASFLAIPESKIDSYIAEELVTELYLRKIFYNYIMQVILINVFEEDYYIYEDDEMPIGKSGVKHYFNGVVNIRLEKIGKTPLLVKLDSVEPSALKLILRTKTTLDDSGYNRAVIFSPTYPSPDALKMENFLERVEEFDLTVLYLHDLYEMIKIGQKAMIREYLENRVRI